MERIQAISSKHAQEQVWLMEVLAEKPVNKFPERVTVHTPETAEEAAENLRTAWNIGESPIDSVAGVIEDNGGILIEIGSPPQSFHGLSGWANATYPVTVYSSQAPDDRKRFSLCHELAHLAMASADIPAKTFEQLANRFAAAFLVPASVARRELGNRRRKLSIPELAMLKKKHGLSMLAWARRALDLDIITQGHYQSLCKAFSISGWRKREPVEFDGRERPSKLRQMVLRAVAEGIILKSKALELCPGALSDEDFQSLQEATTETRASDALNLPHEQRAKLMDESTQIMRKEYEDNPELADFDSAEGDYID
jgi:Zn-dependent peptidase ImmA (M78 family)